jgi:ATP-dependent Clp protease ATP-binding subunit ClpA
MLLDPNSAGSQAEALEIQLRRFIAGQDEAIRQIVSIYQMDLIGLTCPGRPIGSFLFLGPTGSGKTRTVEATAECLLNNPLAVTKIDCAEFRHSHEIAKLIGSPPGYIGHRETRPALAQETLDQYHTDKVKISFVLFDEIEKASDALWNLLLGILDKATLTLGDNRRVDFSRAMIFMTSNLGASDVERLLNPGMGFASPGRLREVSDGEMTPDLIGKMTRTSIEAARRKFTPEFMNRLDKIVVFKPLGPRELARIVEIELGRVQERVLQALAGRPLIFNVTEAGKRFLLDEGVDARYGARHLKRAIERLLVQPLSNLIATDQVRSGDWIEIDHEAGAPSMVFVREAEGLPLADTAPIEPPPHPVVIRDEIRVITDNSSSDNDNIWARVRDRVRDFRRKRHGHSHESGLRLIRFSKREDTQD